MANQEVIRKLIAEHQRVKGLIPAPVSEPQKPKEWSFSDILRSALDDVLDAKVEELGLKDLKDGRTPLKGSDYFTEEEIEEFIARITPQKGVDYFDGEDGQKGKDGYTPIKGVDYFDGKDGKNPSPKELEKLFKELLKEVLPHDIGAVGKADVESLLERYEKKSGKSLEKRLNALQDAVMRNYGGHGGSRPTYYDLSSQLDGTTKTFTIANHSKIITITSSSAPFTFRPTIDFTDTATTVTFDASIDAPSMLASGQSIVILLIP